MKHQEIFARLRPLVAEHADVDEGTVTLETRFEDLGDSFEDVTLLMECEETFDLEIPEAASRRMETIGDLAQYILVVQHLKEGE